MKDLVSPVQVATAIGVSQSSIKRWCDEGAMMSIRTVGGHRKIPINAVLEFLRSTGRPLVNPEVLGLPQTSPGRPLVQEKSRLVKALVGGDEQACRQIILNLYLAKHPVSVICDEVLCVAFNEIGTEWGCGDIEVFQERRACEICQRLLHELRRALPELPPTAPIAVGGTLDGDPYTLASSMAELVLREQGWRACSLGNMLPFSTLSQAMCDTRPQLFWLSVSHIRDLDQFLEHFKGLSNEAKDKGVALVVGGKALTQDVRRKMQYDKYCDTFAHLETFATEKFQDASII